MATKTCKACNEELDVGKFTLLSHNAKTGKAYYTGKCKACRTAAVRTGPKTSRVQRDPVLKVKLQNGINEGLSTKEVARLNNVNTATLYTWIKRGFLTPMSN